MHWQRREDNILCPRLSFPGSATRTEQGKVGREHLPAVMKQVIHIEHYIYCPVVTQCTVTRTIR